ncbi:hypothetical protein ECIV_ORF11 [European chub iridovirus]|nr:hypothetical protein ECIV_ORF11 [European chub iridovirus]
MDLWGLMKLGKSMYDSLCMATNYQIPARCWSSSISSKGEEECKRAIEEHTGKTFVKARPIVNPVTGHQLELDCYCHELKLAVEYNGQQHYKYVKFFHGDNKAKYNEQRYRDEIKKLLCKEQGIKLIEVPYTVPVDQISRYIKDHL